MKKKILIIGFLIGILCIFSQKLIQCYNCRNSDKITANLYFKSYDTEGYYYLLNCFKDNKDYLKKIDSIRNTILTHNFKNKYVHSLAFIKDIENFGTGYEEDNRDYDYLREKLVVSSFGMDSIDHRKLSLVFYDNSKSKIDIKHSNVRNINSLDIYCDYSDLDKETLQKIYNTVSEMDFQKKHKDFTYHVFNNYEDKRLDVYIKYGDFGKWFDLKII